MTTGARNGGVYHPAMRVEHALGQRLRELRLDRRLSLKQVAEATDISASFLSLVENGHNDITMARLMRLTRFFGVHIADLLPEDGTPAETAIVRREERPQVSFRSEGIEVFLLAPDTNRAMSVALSVFEPGARPTEFSDHEGEEFFIVLAGTILFTIEGSEPATLREGDSAYYRSNRPHTFENVGKTEARILFAATPPPW